MALSEPTNDAVRLVMGKDATALPDATIEAFIADAVLMAEQCASVVGYSDAKQAAIVKYLTAHLLALSLFRDEAGVLSSKKIGDAQDSYTSAPLGEQMGMTRYGQQAILLDASGCLKNLGKKKATMTFTT